MKKLKAFLLAIGPSFMLVACQDTNPYNSNGQYNDELPGPITIVIHGGAGSMSAENMDAAKQKMFKDALNTALSKGYQILEKGGSSCDAVMEAITEMEDSPLFNAGRGAVLTAQGYTELDASIMDGSTGNAGAIAGASHIKNPVVAAYRVMTHSPHVMVSGDGAEAFAESQDIEMADSAYFLTPRRKEQLKEVLKDKKFGTVGAVALDANGNICAATSTGGMSGKRWGRIGDAPVIGAGTYANNKTCGVSATGWGEYFIRNVAAYDVSAQIEYLGKYPVQAGQSTIDKIEAMGGEGGMIILDKYGNIAMPFNSSGMFRGYMAKGVAEVKIFRD